MRKLTEEFDLIFNAVVLLLSSFYPSKIEEYAIDSFPVKICENIRANRCRITPSMKFRGYVASKREYFHGVRLHIVASSKGYMREFEITPKSIHDIEGLYLLPLNLKEGSVLYADRGYTNYELEDIIKEVEKIKLMAIRKKNSKRFNYFEQ